MYFMCCKEKKKVLEASSNKKNIKYIYVMYLDLAYEYISVFFT